MISRLSPDRCLKLTLVLVAVLALLASCAFPGASAPTLTVTFREGRCTYDGPKTVPLGKITVKLNDDGKGYSLYAIWIATLDPGKTLNDVEAQPAGDAPPWVHEVDAAGPTPAGRSITHTTDLTAAYTEVKPGSALYIICFTREPLTGAGNWGPIMVSK